MFRIFFQICTLSILAQPVLAQQGLPLTDDDFKAEVLRLRLDVDNIQANLHKSHAKFKVGIATATIGYTVTIAGGLLLANGETNAGKALLISGGAVGITGTFLLVDAFKYLDRASGPKYSKKSG